MLRLDSHPRRAPARLSRRLKLLTRFASLLASRVVQFRLRSPPATRTSKACTVGYSCTCWPARLSRCSTRHSCSPSVARALAGLLASHVVPLVTRARRRLPVRSPSAARPNHGVQAGTLVAPESEEIVQGRSKQQWSSRCKRRIPSVQAS